MNSRVLPEPPLSTSEEPSPYGRLQGLDQIGLTPELLGPLAASRTSDGRLRSADPHGEERRPILCGRSPSATSRASYSAIGSSFSSSARGQTARMSSAPLPRSGKWWAAQLTDAEDLPKNDHKADEHRVDEPDGANGDGRPDDPVRRTTRTRILAELQRGDDDGREVDDRDDDGERSVRDDLAVAPDEEADRVRDGADGERDPELERRRLRQRPVGELR